MEIKLFIIMCIMVIVLSHYIKRDSDVYGGFKYENIVHSEHMVYTTPNFVYKSVRICSKDNVYSYDIEPILKYNNMTILQMQTNKMFALLEQYRFKETPNDSLYNESNDYFSQSAQLSQLSLSCDVRYEFKENSERMRIFKEDFNRISSSFKETSQDFINPNIKQIEDLKILTNDFDNLRRMKGDGIEIKDVLLLRERVRFMAKKLEFGDLAFTNLQLESYAVEKKYIIKAETNDFDMWRFGLFLINAMAPQNRKECIGSKYKQIKWILFMFEMDTNIKNNVMKNISCNENENKDEAILQRVYASKGGVIFIFDANERGKQEQVHKKVS